MSDVAQTGRSPAGQATRTVYFYIVALIANELICRGQGAYLDRYVVGRLVYVSCRGQGFGPDPAAMSMTFPGSALCRISQAPSPRKRSLPLGGHLRAGQGPGRL
jgi:hypothetical protein